MASTNDEAIYQVALATDGSEILREYLSTAATEAGISLGALEIEQIDSSEIASSLEFEPVTAAAALYVANIVVSAATGHIIGKALDRIVREKKKPVIVITPSGELLRLDPEKPEELQRLIDRVKGPPS